MTVGAASDRLSSLMLLSIRPRHVATILKGLKTVELRRGRPAIASGQPVAIYSTTPDAAVVALCRVSAVDVDTPAALWPRVGARSGIERVEFDRYFGDAEIAVALHLSDVFPLKVPVSLRQLRTGGPYQPPQTWHFLDQDRIASLFGDHPSRVELADLVAAAS